MLEKKIEAIGKVVRANRKNWMMFRLDGGHSTTGFAPSDPDQDGMLYLNVLEGEGSLFRYIYLGDIVCIDVLANRPKLYR
jgi:hypothetical protein